MTTRVVWLCRHRDAPIHFTADVQRLGPVDYRVHSAPHMAVHLRQHRG